MAFVNTHFKQAGLAGIMLVASAWNSSTGRIFIYSSNVAKPTNLYSSPYTVATYTPYLLIAYTLAPGTFVQDGATLKFNTIPVAKVAGASGTASWAALTSAASGAPDYVVIGDVSTSAGNGMVYLPTTTIVSGTTYSILECTFTIT